MLQILLFLSFLLLKSPLNRRLHLIPTFLFLYHVVYHFSTSQYKQKFLSWQKYLSHEPFLDSILLNKYFHQDMSFCLFLMAFNSKWPLNKKIHQGILSGQCLPILIYLYSILRDSRKLLLFQQLSILQALLPVWLPFLYFQRLAIYL